MAAPTRYQEVITATNYSLVAEDGTPFPVFLRFDGTDDGMATGNIDFTGTDKMFVAAGVRKLSDATQYQTIAEFSASYSANNGAFILSSTWSSDQFTVGIRGTDFNNGSTSSFPAPTTKVATAIFDISGTTAADETNLRINGSLQTLTRGGNPSTGNYGNYPLYIGRRGGTSQPYNGRLYSLVVCGKLASAAEISSTEAYINQKTRAY